MDQNSAGDSIIQWIRDLESGDEEAANQLWNRYFTRLVTLARNRMQNQPRRITDEEDIALSVFNSLCRGAEAGNFSRITDRDDLWALLLTVTKRKIVNYVQKETALKRGGGEVRGESVFSKTHEAWGIDQLTGEEPTAEFAALLDEEHQRLLNLLDDEILSQVAVKRMEGYADDEIAKELGVAPRTIRRKVKLIRETWADELEL